MLSTIHALLRAISILFLFFASPIHAHEGHDGPEPTVSVEMTPRATADSKQFELVAVASNGALDIYLDSFIDNAPVTDAQIVVDTPSGTVQATPIATGTYRLDAPWSTAAGSYPLIFDIKAGGRSDVLAATLIVPAAKTAATESAATIAGKSRQLLLALGGFAAGIAAMGMLRSRRKATAAIVAMAFTASIHHARADMPTATTQDRSQRLTDGSALVPKATQRILAIRTVLTAPAAHRRATETRPHRAEPECQRSRTGRRRR